MAPEMDFSDADLRQFAAISTALLTITDLRGEILSVSSSWREALGWTREDLLSHNFVEFVHPDDVAATLAAFNADAAQQGLVNRYRHANGTYRTLEWTTGTNGTLVWGVARDITVLTVHARQQQVVAQLGRRALEGPTNDVLMDEACTSVAAVLGVPVVTVLEQMDSRLRICALSAFGARVGAGDLVELDPRTVSGRALETAEPATATDVQATHSGYLPHHQARAHGVVAVPIVRPEGVWGVLTCTDVVPRDFDEREVRFLLQVTHILGAAVERRAVDDRLRHLATHDSLTDLPNRELLRLRLEGALDPSVAGHGPIGLLLCDLNGFKDVNDSLGHVAGDEVLLQLADRLRAAVGPFDTVARLGGDEFAICIVGRETEIEVLGVADTIIRSMKLRFPVADLQVTLSTSIGVVLSPRHGNDPSTLLRHADIAMYRAKSQGLGWSVYEPALDAAKAERLALTTALRDAIAADGLEVQYQPIVDLATGRLRSVEALCRWTHPQFGVISPSRFIPLAEQTGTILPLTGWVLERVVRDVRAWHAAGHPVRCSVNLSMAAVADAVLSADLLDQFVEAADLITVEITESWLVEELGREVIAKLSANGVGLSLDDFGTGFSSLASLHRFPVQQVKLDRAFVLGLDGPRGARVLQAMTHLGQALDMEVVAEGVEDQETSERLQAAGLLLGQGFLWSAALPSDALTPWLAGAHG